MCIRSVFKHEKEKANICLWLFTLLSSHKHAVYHLTLRKNQPGKTGFLGLPRSRLYYQFLIKIFELSYEKQAVPG